MAAQPHPRAVLQRAIRTGDAALALRAAGELERVDLEAAFAICLLLRADQARYDRACVRWLERFAAEVEGATLSGVHFAGQFSQGVVGGRGVRRGRGRC
jgi:hypothetical protein